MDDGLKTLFALYKSPIWVEGDISEDEMDIAKEQGYLFDYPEYETHSDMLQRLRSIRALFIRQNKPQSEIKQTTF